MLWGCGSWNTDRFTCVSKNVHILDRLHIQHWIPHIQVAEEGAHVGVSFLEIQHSAIVYNNQYLWKRWSATLLDDKRVPIRCRRNHAFGHNPMHAPNKVLSEASEINEVTPSLSLFAWCKGLIYCQLALLPNAWNHYLTPKSGEVLLQGLIRCQIQVYQDNSLINQHRQQWRHNQPEIEINIKNK